MKSYLRAFIQGIVIACSLSLSGITIAAVDIQPGNTVKFNGNKQSGEYTFTYISKVDGSTQEYKVWIPNSYKKDPAHHGVIFLGRILNSGYYFMPWECYNRLHHDAHGNPFEVNIFPQKQYAESTADRPGFIYVTSFMRGNTMSYGIAEDDFFNVIHDLKLHYNYDSTRMYYEGFCGGATGAYRLGILFPDILAGTCGVDGIGSKDVWYPEYYSPNDKSTTPAPLYQLPNLLMASSADICGRAINQSMEICCDLNDTIVFPENGKKLDQAFQAAIKANTHPELRDTSIIEKEQEYNLGLYDPNLDHTAAYHHDIFGGELHYNTWRNPQQMLNDITKHKLNTYPMHVVNVANRLRYGKLYWTSIDRICNRDQLASLDATIENTNGDVTIEVIASNVLQFTLTIDYSQLPLQQNHELKVVTQLAGMQNSSIIYDKKPYDPTMTSLSVFATLTVNGITGYQATNELPSQDIGKHKTINCEGPIGDAFTVPFKVYYGNQMDGNGINLDKSEADCFVSNWEIEVKGNNATTTNNQGYMSEKLGDGYPGYPYGTGTVYEHPATDSPGLDNEEDCNLVLFGTSASNPLIAAVENYSSNVDQNAHHRRPPIKVGVMQNNQANIMIGNQYFPLSQYGVMYVFPNPAKPSRLIVVINNFGVLGRITPYMNYAMLQMLSWHWPDYVIIDNTSVHPPRNCNYNTNYYYLPDMVVGAATGYFTEQWGFVSMTVPSSNTAYKNGDTIFMSADVGQMTGNIQVDFFQVLPSETYNNAINCGNDNGVDGSHYICATPGITTLTNNQQYTFVALHTNTGACTARIGTAPASNLKNPDGTDPVPGSIPNGSPVVVQYNGTNLVLRSPLLLHTATTAPYNFNWTNVNTGVYKLYAQARQVVTGNVGKLVTNAAMNTVLPVADAASNTDKALTWNNSYISKPVTVTVQ